jgi:hypothetical protein
MVSSAFIAIDEADQHKDEVTASADSAPASNRRGEQLLLLAVVIAKKGSLRPTPQPEDTNPQEPNLADGVAGCGSDDCIWPDSWRRNAGAANN